MDKESALLIDQVKIETDIFAKARLITILVDERDVRVVDVAVALNIKPSYVCHIMRLVRIPEMIVDGYYSKMISLSHLFILSRLKEEKDMISLYEKILADNMTVNQTENSVRKILYGINADGSHLSEREKDEFINRINSIGKNISAKIVQTQIKAKLQVEFKGSLKETSKALREIMKKFNV